MDPFKNPDSVSRAAPRLGPPWALEPKEHQAPGGWTQGVFHVEL